MYISVCLRVCVCVYVCVCVCISIETGSGQSAYPGQLGHFLSGSRGSPGQLKGNQIIRFMLFKMATVNSAQDSERLPSLECS